MGELIESTNNEIANRLNEETTDTVVLIPDSEVVYTKEEITIPAAARLQMVEQPKASRTRKPTEGKKVPVKPTDVDGIVGKLEDQIKALRFLNSVQTADIPTPLEKGVRETLLSYQKDIQVLKSKYITIIQKG